MQNNDFNQSKLLSIEFPGTLEDAVYFIDVLNQQFGELK
jgi:hypothetical protein